MAFVPAAVLGLLFSDAIDAMLERVEVVAVMLVLGGIFMLYCDKIFNKGSEDTPFTEKRAFMVGLFQCISMQSILHLTTLPQKKKWKELYLPLKQS